MRRLAFTLLEMLISITLIALMVTLVYGGLDNIKLREDIAIQNAKTRNKNNEIKKLLYEDILESNDIELETTKEKNTILHLVTTNIYHDKRYSYVIYKLSNQHNLLRIELPKKPKPSKPASTVPKLSYEEAFVDKVIDKVDSFSVYRGKNRDTLLISIVRDGKKMVLKI
jgi:prepilin-type N-terminal cleavage/methylation domain-containing protein